MAYVNVVGGRLWYSESAGAGSGTPLVFVHPAAGTSASWDNQVGPFTAAGYRCITYDLRGWGKSDPVDPSDTGTLSDDLESLVRALNLERFVLIAAAYGGFGGLDYALRFPHRLQALVLATTQGGLSGSDYTDVLERAVPEAIRGLPKHLRELGPSYRAENPQGVERWLEIDRQGQASGPRRQRLHMQLTLPALESLRVPTLLIAGGADLLAPPALMRLLAERIPNAIFEVIAEAGHSAHWERPEEWNRLVLRFLSRS